MTIRHSTIALGALLLLSACEGQDARFGETGFDTGLYAGMLYEVDGSAEMRTACEIAGNVIIIPDIDGDEYGSFEGCGQPDQAWPFGLANVIGDCNDNLASVHPNQTEICGNGIDDNCVGGMDEGGCITKVTDCRADFDNDGYTTGGAVPSADADCNDPGEAQLTEPAGDCNDTNVDVHPNAAEVCNDVDDDCDADGRVDEGIGVQAYGQDVDGDTYGSKLITKQDCSQPAGYVQNLLDCDDLHASAKPGGTEVPGNGIDEDCDGLGDDSVSGSCFVDADNDLWRTGLTVANNDLDCDDSGEAYSTEQSGDCNDSNFLINPGAVDTTVDGIDQNCMNGDGDGSTTICYADVDNDGFRTGTVVTNNDQDCNDTGEAAVNEPSGDCNDSNASIYPGAVDTTVDGIDQNCVNGDGDGAMGTSCFADYDNDNVRTGISVLSADADCNDSGEANATELSGDCNDLDPAVKPGAVEVVGDSIDQDCNGIEMCFQDVDNDAFRPTNATLTTSSSDTDCYDANESTLSDVASDCNDTVASIKPGAVETCNSIDDDCDSVIDDGVAQTAWYQDADADGYGNWSVSSLLSCTQPSGRVSTGGDCNDGNNAIKPNVTEIPGDSVDQNCDGTEVCFTDADNDGYRPNSTSTTTSSDVNCTDGNEAVSSDPTTDCNDGSAAVRPGATEISGNGIDEDCNGSDLTSGIYYRDGDGDNYGMNSDWRTTAAFGYVAAGGDCNDGNSSIHPNASDPINGVDEDCSGQDGVGASTRTSNVWTFTLDSAATALTLDQFEVKNLTSGVNVSTTSRVGSVVSITLSTKPTDVLSVQCWLAGNTQWCAANGHTGHVVSATGPTGSYSVGQTTGDIKYVSNGNNGFNYGGSVK